jgi:hypothetical protein
VKLRHTERRVTAVAWALMNMAMGNLDPVQVAAGWLEAGGSDETGS